MKNLTKLAVAMMAAFILSPTAASAEPVNADPLSISSDFRFRGDVDMREGDGVDSKAEQRFRPRLRARLGLKYKTDVKGLSFGIRLATNPGNPGNSPHQTMDGYSGHGIALDRAYLRYAPIKQVKLFVGKHALPIWKQTEAFWDDDIQPEGFSLAGGIKAGPGMVHYVLGNYYLHNVGWSEGLMENHELRMGQLRYSGSFGMVEPTLAVTAAKYSAEFTDTGDDTGHKFTDPLFWMASLQVKLKNLPVGVTLGFDLHGSTATSDEMKAEHTKGMVGQLRIKKDAFGVRYYYYDVDEAAVPFYVENTLSQDNFPNSRGGGLTGFVGHRIQLDYKISKHVGTDFRVYLQEGKKDNELSFAESSERKIKRFQLNVNLKF